MTSSGSSSRSSSSSSSVSGGLIGNGEGDGAPNADCRISGGKFPLLVMAIVVMLSPSVANTAKPPLLG